MNKLLKSVLKTAVYFLDQTDRFTTDVRDRVSDGLDEASDRVSDIRRQARDLYDGGDHTMRNVLTFAAGVGVGVGVAVLFAPASGEEVRNSISDKVHDIGDRVRGRFATEVRSATGTEGSSGL
jgi:hypothetical protein